MGRQSLYTVSITVDVKGYGESDMCSHLFGFRKIESFIDSNTGGRCKKLLGMLNITKKLDIYLLDPLCIFFL